MFQFSCRFSFFINFSSFKPDTENKVHFDAASSKRASFDELQFFSVSKLVRFVGTQCSLNVYLDRRLFNILSRCTNY